MLFRRRTFANEYLSKKTEKYEWSIECEDGTHNILVEMGTYRDKPIVLYVDKERVDTIRCEGGGLIRNIKRDFECGGETLTLLVFGGKIDIIQNDMLQKSNIKYNPEAVLPKSYRIVFTILNILSLSLFFLPGLDFSSLPIIWGMSALMVLLCSIVVSYCSKSPFYTRKKKILYSILITLWSWILIGSLIFVFYAISRYGV